MSKSKFILFITGVSGAGKTEALKCLEDMGYDCIDNMPLRLIPTLLKDVEALPDRLVLAIDGRNTDIGLHNMAALDAIKTLENVETQTLFLNADDEELIRRYKETRRSHPSSAKCDIRTAISQERKILKPYIDSADVILDTSDFAPKQLWQYIKERFETPNAQTLQVYVMSFGYKHGMPREADYVFDVRYLKNPYWVADLKEKTGLDADVRAYVKEDAHFNSGLEKLVLMLEEPLTIFKRVDRASVTIAVGCTGGQHRSVTMAIELANKLSSNFNIHLYHRDVKGDA